MFKKMLRWAQCGEVVNKTMCMTSKSFAAMYTKIICYLQKMAMFYLLVASTLNLAAILDFNLATQFLTVTFLTLTNKNGNWYHLWLKLSSSQGEPDGQSVFPSPIFA